MDVDAPDGFFPKGTFDPRLLFGHKERGHEYGMIRIWTRDLFKKFSKPVCGPLDRAGVFAYVGVSRSVSPVRNRTAV